MKFFPPWMIGSLVFGFFVLLIWQERRRPLRKRVEPDFKHSVRNLIIAFIGVLAMLLFEAPLIQPLARLVEARHWGLLGLVDLPVWLEAAIALVLMDYTFYLWHLLMHRVPLLWRFHAVHHVDLDLDVTTALRFHFGELLVSIPWRAAQVLVIGLNPLTFAIWQLFFALCVMFHHANLRLPLPWERRINRILVTPRMHGIHHSNVQEETDSNWSSGLTIWDWVHGTLRLNVPQKEIVIGVTAYNTSDTIGLPAVLALPFRDQPEFWRFPDGTAPKPNSTASSASQVLD